MEKLEIAVVVMALVIAALVYCVYDIYAQLERTYDALESTHEALLIQADLNEEFVGILQKQFEINKLLAGL
jgi:uncharacterized protein YoxC